MAILSTSSRAKVPKSFRETKEFKKAKISMSTKKFSPGNFTDKTTTPKRYTINRAGTVLANQGLKEEETFITTTEKKSHDLLHAMGYTVEISQQDYTLVDSQTDYEPIENPAIADDIPAADLQNELIDMTHSFTNQCDSIYELDDVLPNSLQVADTYISLETAQSLDLVNTGNAFSGMGLMNTSDTATSRYFNNSQVSIALKATKR